MVVRIGEYEIRPFNGDRMEKADPTVTADIDRAIERIEAACAEVERKCGELNKRLKAVA